MQFKNILWPAALIFGGGGLLLSSRASGEAVILPITQNRNVSASAGAVYYNHTPSTASQSFSASDFLMFDQIAGASASDTIVAGSAIGKQTSWFDDSRIVATGMGSFLCSSYVPPPPHSGSATARGGSLFELTFALTEPALISLTGLISTEPRHDLGASGSAWYALRRADQSQTFSSGTLTVSWGPPPQTRNIDEQLTLQAGQYTLMGSALAQGENSSDLLPFVGGTTQFSLDLRVLPDPVPEPAAIVMLAAISSAALLRRRHGCKPAMKPLLATASRRARSYNRKIPT